MFRSSFGSLTLGLIGLISVTILLGVISPAQAQVVVTHPNFDSDGDGFSDLIDNAPFNANDGGQADSDNDGAADVIDSDHADPDDDGDGVVDGLDANPRDSSDGNVTFSLSGPGSHTLGNPLTLVFLTNIAPSGSGPMDGIEGALNFQLQSSGSDLWWHGLQTFSTISLTAAEADFLLGPGAGSRTVTATLDYLSASAVDSVNINVVPEPTSVLLALLGGLSLAVRIRRQ